MMGTEEYMRRIAEALEKLVKCMIPFLPVAIYEEGENSVHETLELKGTKEASLGMKVIETDSKPLSQHDQKIMRAVIPQANVIIHDDPKPLPKVVQTQNYVDVRECKDYSEKSYKLIGYDGRYEFLAKSHVIRTESIEGGGTRVIVPSDKAWVINKLEWK